MRRHIRALGHEAHVAQVAVIHDLPEHPPLEARDFAVRASVHRVEQRGKGVAQAEAAAAALADVEHALELRLERYQVVELRVAPLQRVPGGGLQAPLACAQMLSRAFWKRLACERSALASVSNQSAISPKPSSRAAFAMPGYMSVYSCVSPAMAAFRFSRVRPIGRLVAGSPTASRYSRWPCACPVSPSSVERKSADSSLWPSTSALAAK